MGFRRSAIVVVLAALPSLIAIPGHFIWTDHVEVIEGGLVRRGYALAVAIVNGIDGHYYRPTIFAIHSLNAWLFGPDPLFFRGTNALLHVLNSFLLFTFATRVLKIGWGALAAACLFAIHPVAVTVVSWTSDRTDAIALAASLTVMLTGWTFRRTGSVLVFVTAVVVLLVGLGAKESAACSVLMIGALALIESERTCRKRILFLAGALLATCVAWFWWRARVSTTPVSATGSDLDLIRRFALATKIHVGYALELVAPWTLRACDDVFVPTQSWPWLVLGGVAVSVIAVASIRARRETIFAVLWVCISLLPTSNILFVLKHARADRYLYAVLPGLAILAGLLLSRMRWRNACLGAIYVAFALCFVERARHFRSDRDLWVHETTLSNSCREGHAYLGKLALAVDGNDTVAVNQSGRALADQPDLLAFVDVQGVLSYRAMALVGVGDQAQGEAILAGLVERGTYRYAAEANYHLGLLRLLDKQYQAAADFFQRAATSPHLITVSRDDCLLFWSYSLAKTGNLNLAREKFSKINPSIAKPSPFRTKIVKELRSLLQ